MKDRRTIVGWAVAALLLHFFGAASVTAQPDNLDRWLRVYANQLSLYSDGEADIALRVARGLLGFRAVFSRLAPELEMQASAPTVVVAFADSRSYSPYRHTGGTPGGRVIGQFLSHPEGNAILVDAGGELLDALAVVYHESVHDLVRLNFPRAPLWFHEGLAEYYSTLRIGDEAIEVGAPVERHLAWLRTTERLELAEIVQIPGDAKGLEQTEHVGHFYAVSWALVHHLLSGGDRGLQRTADFLVALHDGASPEEAFYIAFPEGSTALEEELTKRIASGAFSATSLPLDSLGSLGNFRSRSASQAEILAMLGHLLARQGRPDEATRHFTLALDYDESNVAALVGLGHLSTGQGNLDEAATFFGQALEAGTLDAQGWLLLGKYKLSEAERQQAEGRTSEFLESVTDSRQAFEASRSAAPGFVEARAMLGVTYLYEGDPQMGIAELTWARLRTPDRADLAYYLAHLYIRTEEFNRAERTINENLDPVKHAEFYQRATEALDRASLLDEADRAFANADLEVGFERLKEAIEVTTDKGTRHQLEARYEALRRQHGLR